MSEEWRPVLGYEGAYEVSNLGRVRSLDRIIIRRGGKADGRPMRMRGRIKKPTIESPSGYPIVNLGHGRTRRVHALVMEAFVGPRPAGMEVRHLDGKADNCVLSNLAYGYPSDNAYDRVRHGTHPDARKTHCLRGHPFDSKNTYITSAGSRNCRTWLPKKICLGPRQK